MASKITITNYDNYNKMKFDLEERTAKFGDSVIEFCRRVPQNNITSPLVSQIVRSATSVGANYCEADDAESKKDFIHKIGICRKESRETKHWLRMIANAEPLVKEEARRLWIEAQELNLIFSKIVHTCRKNMENPQS